MNNYNVLSRFGYHKKSFPCYIVEELVVVMVSMSTITMVSIVNYLWILLFLITTWASDYYTRGQKKWPFLLFDFSCFFSSNIRLWELSFLRNYGCVFYTFSLWFFLLFVAKNLHALINDNTKNVWQILCLRTW